MQENVQNLCSDPIRLKARQRRALVNSVIFSATLSLQRRQVLFFTFVIPYFT